MKASQLLACGVALAVAAVWHRAHRPVWHGPGEIAPDAPLQQPLLDARAPWQSGDFTIKPLARFSVRARVLSRADYHFDRESRLSPTDLALGWGPMSDSAVLDKFDVSQSGRFYFWRVDTFPIPQQRIIESSSNMHMIPGDGAAARALARARVGDVVDFDGFLVQADAPGYQWTSSLTRQDSGAGACELVWVEHFSIAPAR